MKTAAGPLPMTICRLAILVLMLVGLTQNGAGRSAAAASGPACPAGASFDEILVCLDNKLNWSTRLPVPEWCESWSYEKITSCFNSVKDLRFTQPPSPCPVYVTPEKAIEVARQHAAASGMTLPDEAPKASWFGRMYQHALRIKPDRLEAYYVVLTPTLQIHTCWGPGGVPCAPLPDRSQSICERSLTPTSEETYKAASDHLAGLGIEHYPWKPGLLNHHKTWEEIGWVVQFPAGERNEPFTVIVNWEGKPGNIMPGM